MSNLSCLTCGRTCKDKKGLTLHQNKCNPVKPSLVFQCEFCYKTCSTQQNLNSHLNSCKERNRQEIERKINEVKQQYDKEKESLLHQHSKQLTDLTSKFAQEKEMLSHKNDFYISQIKSDLDHKIKECDKLNEEISVKDKTIKELKQELSTTTLERREISRKMISFAEKATSNQGGNTIIQGSHIHNHLQLQHFNPSLIMGHIKPPDVIIRSIPQLVDHIMKLGFSNFYRISDRARKSILWVDEGGNTVKDSNCSMMSKRVIDTLRPELDKQQVYLEQQLEFCSNKPDKDLDKLISLQQDVSFTKCLRKEDKSLMKNLQTEIASRAKNKNDTTVDTPKLVGYTELIEQIEQCLYANIHEWIGLTLPEFGRYLQQTLPNYINVEGASSSAEKPYVVVQDDNHHPKMVYHDEISSYVLKALEDIFQPRVLKLIRHLMTSQISRTSKEIDEMLNKLETAVTSGSFSEHDSIQLLDGMIGKRA